MLEIKWKQNKDGENLDFKLMSLSRNSKDETSVFATLTDGMIKVIYYLKSEISFIAFDAGNMDCFFEIILLLFFKLSLFRMIICVISRST